jgi:hypothetical protein
MLAPAQEQQAQEPIQTSLVLYFVMVVVMVDKVLVAVEVVAEVLVVAVVVLLEAPLQVAQALQGKVIPVLVKQLVRQQHMLKVLVVAQAVRVIHQMVVKIL